MRRCAGCSKPPRTRTSLRHRIDPRHEARAPPCSVRQLSLVYGHTSPVGLPSIVAPEIAREKERKRREQAIAKAETALEEAKRDHEIKIEEINRDRAALDRRSRAEDARWEKQKEKLETALRRVRD
jgi:hypothetical protein